MTKALTMLNQPVNSDESLMRWGSLSLIVNNNKTEEEEKTTKKQGSKNVGGVLQR
jgi:hypothetical protein